MGYKVPTVSSKQANEQKKAIRLSAATRLLKYAKKPDAINEEAYLFNIKDNELLQAGIANENLTLEQAVQAVINNIEPDPALRKSALTTSISPERTAELKDAITQLVQGKPIKAKSLSDLWQDFKNSNIVQWALLEPIFKENKLPSSAKQIFRKKSDEVKSLFSSIEGVMDILTDPIARDQLYSDLELRPYEEKALTTYVKFYEEFKKTFEENHHDLDLINTFKKFAPNELREYGIHYFGTEEGNIDTNVIGAMAMSAMQWLTRSGPNTLYNDESAIKSILGKDDSYHVTSDQRNKLQYSGTLRNGVVRDLNNDILNQLNLADKNNPNISPMMASKLGTTLGTVALSTLRNMGAAKDPENRGRVEFVNVDSEWFLNETDTSNENITTEKVGFVRSRPEAEVINGELVYDDVNRKLRNLVHEGSSIFNILFGSVANSKTPVFKKPKKEDMPTKISRSLTKISDVMQARMFNDTQKEWNIQSNAMGNLKKIPKLEFMQRALGYINDDTIENDIHIERQDAVRGKNQGILRDLDGALDFYEENGNKITYFLKKMTRNGRVLTDSNLIDPQNKKIHRFLFTMKGWVNKVSTKNEEDMNNAEKLVYDNFLLAVAPAFGISVDKMYLDTALTEMKALLETKQMKDALLVLASDKEQFSEEDMKVLWPFLDEKSKIGGEGTHTLAALTALSRRAHSAEATVEIDLPFESDGITNGFVSTLLQLAPATITKEYVAMLNAGGIFLKEDVKDENGNVVVKIKYKNAAQYIDDGGLDNYQQVSHGTSVHLDRMTDGEYIHQYPIEDREKSNKELRNEDIQANVANVVESGFLPDPKTLIQTKDNKHKEGRDWTKYPLMITAYGAGIASVIRTVVDAAMDKFYEDLEKAANSDPEIRAGEIARVMNGAIKIGNTALIASHNNDLNTNVGPKDGWKSLDATMIEKISKGDPKSWALNYKPTPAFNQFFAMAITETYGRALEKALESHLVPIQDTRMQLNHANKLMNMVFVEDFTRRVQFLEESRNRILTPVERREILNDMHKEGLIPSLATDLSVNNNENLETTNYGNEYIQGNLGKARAQFNKAVQIIDKHYTGLKGNLTPAGRQSNVISRILAEAPNDNIGVSGVIKGIHGTDGVVNSSVWGTKKWDVNNVHDAQIVNFLQSAAVVNAVNKEYFELHGRYNIKEEFYKSTMRIFTSLMLGEDSRLTKKTKEKLYDKFIHYLDGEPELDLAGNPIKDKFGNKKRKRPPYVWATELHALPFVDRVDNTPSHTLVTMFLQDMRRNIQETNEGKKEVFDRIAYVSQFAREGAEYKTENSPIEEVNTGILFNDEEKGSLFNIAANLFSDDNRIKRKEAIDNLTQAVIEGTDNEFLRNWVEEDKPSAKQVMEVIQVAYRKVGHPAGEQLAILNNVVSKHLGSVNVILTPLTDATAKYQNGKIKINSIINPNDETRVVRDLVHEIVHAATIPALNKLIQGNKPEFDKLLETATTWATETRKGMPKDSYLYKITEEVIQYTRKDNDWPILAISEYLAHVLTASKAGNQYSLLFPTEANFMGLIGNLVETLANPVTRKIDFKSSPDNINSTLFVDKVAEKLEADKMQMIFDRLESLDLGDQDIEHNNHLRELIDNLVIPGMTSIESKMQQVIANNPGSEKNIGEVEGDLIRLEVAGNKLTSNVDMSLTEVAVHEYLHPIIKEAINNDHFVRKEVRRLYEQSKAKMNPDGSDFLPPSDQIVGDPAIAREKAKERYDYIFNNPDGRHYDEFMVIALTNKAFAQALQNTNNEVVEITAPDWSQGILKGIINLARMVIQKLSGQSLETKGGNIGDAVYAIAQAGIAANQRNLQRIKDIEDGKDLTSTMQKWNNKTKDVINDRIIEPFAAGLASVDRKRLDPDNPSLPGFLKSATYVALKSKNTDTREHYNKFYRSMANPEGVGKDNAFFEVLSEISGWNEDNLGDGKQVGWIDLLRKSKRTVDQARMQIASHTRKYIDASFDPNNHLTKAVKQSITRVMLNTDMVALRVGENSLTANQIQDMLNDPNKINTHLDRYNNELKQELSNQNATALFEGFNNHTRALGRSMVTGKMDIENGVLNAHNIVNQWYLSETARTPLNNKEDLINLVDKIATLKSLQFTPDNDIKSALTMINHEMSRDPSDNGFTNLLGMQNDFRNLAMEKLFADQPGQMMKGYTHEMFDGEVNIEYIDDTPEERKRMQDSNMYLVGEVSKDTKLDPFEGKRLLYKGLKGLNTYNKSIVSLTDMQHRGANLFTTAGYQSRAARKALNEAKTLGYQIARNNHNNPNYISEGENMVPVFNNQGNIVDYRYMMSERNKQKILKKDDSFDQVLPLMFASISDRNSSKEINNDVVDLLWKEYDGLLSAEEKKDGYNENYRFVDISRTSKTQEGRDMWHLMPEDMQRAVKAKFGRDGFYVRDDVVNLVLGFRKMSISRLGSKGGTQPSVWGKERSYRENGRENMGRSSIFDEG